MGATTDGHGTDTDQQSTGQRCGRNPATGICLHRFERVGKGLQPRADTKALRVRVLAFNRSRTMMNQFEHTTMWNYTTNQYQPVIIERTFHRGAAHITLHCWL